MIKPLLNTTNDLPALVLRLTLGIVMLPHGLQKTIGWFGGGGFSGTMGYFTENLSIPTIIAFLVILAESAGALALIAGFLTRLAAAGIAAVMLGATFMVHLQFGFFMNWSGQQQGEGFEFHLLAIGIAIALIIRGGGLWSVDAKLAPHLSQPPE